MPLDGNVSKFTWFLFGMRPLPCFPSVIYSLFIRHFCLNLVLSLACGDRSTSILGTYAYELMYC